MRVPFLWGHACGVSLLVACNGTVVRDEATGGDPNAVGSRGASAATGAGVGGAVAGSTSRGAGGATELPAGVGGAGGQAGGVGAGSMDQPATGGFQGGGGAREASCDRDVSTCGGEMSGTFTVTASCLVVEGELDLSMLGLGCLFAPVTGSREVTGTWTIQTSMTYSDDTHVTGNEELELPSDCLAVSGVTTTCERLGTPIAALGYESVTCEENATTGGCTCRATLNQTGGLGAAPLADPFLGGYVIGYPGGTFTTFPQGQQYSYCGDGTTLTVTPLSAGGSGTVTGMVVLEAR